MKATELRIGNWVRIKDVPTTNEWQVESTGNLQQVGGQLWSIEELEPIPLTEEWAVKFGFVNKGHGYSNNIYYRQNELENWGYILIFSKTGIVLEHGFMNSWKELRVLKYAHTLQNVYYSLEYEELTIK